MSNLFGISLQIRVEDESEEEKKMEEDLSPSSIGSDIWCCLGNDKQRVINRNEARDIVAKLRSNDVSEIPMHDPVVSMLCERTVEEIVSLFSSAAALLESRGIKKGNTKSAHTQATEGSCDSYLKSEYEISVRYPSECAVLSVSEQWHDSNSDLTDTNRRKSVSQWSHLDNPSIGAEHSRESTYSFLEFSHTGSTTIDTEETQSHVDSSPKDKFHWEIISSPPLRNERRPRMDSCVVTYCGNQLHFGNFSKDITSLPLNNIECSTISEESESMASEEDRKSKGENPNSPLSGEKQ